MAICPKCQANVEIAPQFFGGLFTCPKCQAVYFTNFDGVPEGAPMESSPDYGVQQTSLSGEPEPVFQSESTYQQESMYQPEIAPQPEIAIPTETPAETESFFEPAPMSSSAPPPQDMSEVVRYGNSEPSNSPMSYRLVIQGLDLMQNVNELKDILSEAKLQISFEEIKKKIRQGTLTLEKLSPAKAAILAQRLRTLELHMTWELKIYD